MVIIKILLTKILSVLLPTNIVSQTYTTGAASTWVKSATITIQRAGVYRIRASYSNSAVLGIAYSATTATNIVQSVIIKENTTGASIDTVVWLPSGTYSFWTKCVTASKQNSIVIWKVLVL